MHNWLQLIQHADQNSEIIMQYSSLKNICFQQTKFTKFLFYFYLNFIFAYLFILVPIVYYEFNERLFYYSNGFQGILKNYFPDFFFVLFPCLLLTFFLSLIINYYVLKFFLLTSFIKICRRAIF
jgi:hypothetical protein